MKLHFSKAALLVYYLLPAASSFKQGPCNLLSTPRAAYLVFWMKEPVLKKADI